jgi:NAD(P)-dependent dehydrogenase (short-subunit alcohol dehydrogenase family)
MVDLLKMIWNGRIRTVDFPPGLSFLGKEVLITGATSGLGYETAVHFVMLGAKTVHITGRTIAKADTSKTGIEARTGTNGVVQTHELDMDTFQGVTRFADAFVAKVKSIDIVLLNAGITVFSYRQSPDGWESCLQVNYLSTTLLGIRMLEWMKSTQPPGKILHLGFVSSGTHCSPDITAKDFPQQNVLKHWNDENSYKAAASNYYYGLSKLFLQYAIKELAILAEDVNGR